MTTIILDGQFTKVRATLEGSSTLTSIILENRLVSLLFFATSFLKKNDNGSFVELFIENCIY